MKKEKKTAAGFEQAHHLHLRLAGGLGLEDVFGAELAETVTLVL